MKRLFTICLVLLLCASSAYSVKRTDARDSRADIERKIDAVNDVANGTVWFVDSGATGGATGVDWTNAVLTAEAAVDKASAEDTIWFAPGHNEAFTAADAVDADKAGLTFRGFGRGTLQPTFDYDDIDGEFVIGADNITLINLYFRASSTSTVNAIDIENGKDYTSIIGCRFDNETDATDSFVDAINLGDACIGTLIEDCKFDSGLQATAASAIYLDFDTVDVVIQNNDIFGDYSTAQITGDTTLSTNLIIRDNTLVQGASGNIGTQPCIDLLTGTTGIITGNFIACNVATVDAAMETVDTMFVFDNWYSEDVGADKAGTPWHVGTFGGSLIDSVSASGDD